MHEEIDRVLFDEHEIELAIQRVAGEITRAHAGTELTVVAVLKGSCIFVADLVREIPIPLRLTFVAAESYREGTTRGALSLDWLDSGREVRGRRVLLVDDVVDTGHTLAAIRSELLARGATAVETCALLDKPARRALPLEIDYRCFEVGDVFVVGYGLDHAGRHRNLPYVAALRQPLPSAEARRV